MFPEKGASVSAAIVTHDRPERVRQLLRSLDALRSVRFEEVLVVDDSTSPPKYAPEFPGLELRHVVLPERRFISYAKNAALGKVRSEFTFFVDDDNVVEDGTLAPLIGRIEQTPRIVALMPSVVYHRRPELVWVYATPYRRDRWGFDLVGRNRPRDPTWEGRLLPTDALPNSSLVRTDAARAVGGFDPALPVNSSADFCQRLKATGAEVWADSRAFTRHDVELPGQRAFWAEHSVDPGRTYYEVRDWFLFQRRVHRAEPFRRGRALLHAAPFLLTAQLAFMIRPDAPTFRLSRTLIEGTLAGLREPAGDATAYPN